MLASWKLTLMENGRMEGEGEGGGNMLLSLGTIYRLSVQVKESFSTAHNTQHTGNVHNNNKCSIYWPSCHIRHLLPPLRPSPSPLHSSLVVTPLLVVCAARHVLQIVQFLRFYGATLNEQFLFLSPPLSPHSLSLPLSLPKAGHIKCKQFSLPRMARNCNNLLVFVAI